MADAAPESAQALLLCRDLIFTSKITGTASLLGLRVDVVGGRDRVLQRLAHGGIALLLIDLASGDLAAAEALAAYRAAAPELPLIAFGSHVDTQALDQAAQAGCDEVMPRSRFVRELPDILQRHLKA